MEEITEDDIKQGKIIYDVYKDMMPEIIPKMEFMVKSVGWEGTLAFMNNEKMQQMPEQVRELNITCLKYLHHKFQSESKSN